MFSSVETPAKLGSTPQQGFCQQTLIIISITVNDNLSWWSSNHYHHHQFKWGLLFIIFIIISSLFVIVIIICHLFMFKKKCLIILFKDFPVISQLSPCNKSYWSDSQTFDDKWIISKLQERGGVAISESDLLYNFQPTVDRLFETIRLLNQKVSESS